MLGWQHFSSPTFDLGVEDVEHTTCSVKGPIWPLADAQGAEQSPT